MKHYIIFIAVVLLSVSTAIAINACSHAQRIDEMCNIINVHEADLNSICDSTSFLDTVGETDAYMYLSEALDEFDDAVADMDEERIRIAFGKYEAYYKMCMDDFNNINRYAGED